MKRCLYCYGLLENNEADFHSACSKKIFGQATPPVVNYLESQMEDLALQVVRSHMAVTGVQPKISLGLSPGTGPGLDVINFFEQVLFSFLTGNADMHLKNFSLIRQPGIGNILSPAYDMVATALVNPADDEDMALTLNGRKKKITRKDFITAFTSLNLDIKQQENIFKKMEKAKDKWMEFIDVSFLNTDFKSSYKNLIHDRFFRLRV
jgi:hypothetical protein